MDIRVVVPLGRQILTQEIEMKKFPLAGKSSPGATAAYKDDQLANHISKLDISPAGTNHHPDNPRAAGNTDLQQLTH